MSNLFYNNEKLKAFQKALSSEKLIVVEELWNSPKALLASIGAETLSRNVLIVTGQSQEEARIFHDFSYFTNTPVVNFPAWETLPSENVAPSPDIVGERYEVLKTFSKGSKGIVISSLSAALQKLIAPKEFFQLNLALNVGMKISFDDFQKKLVEMGYEKKGVASDKGEFAVRGGILDVFPVSHPDPYRLEFFDDTIESIRIFDPIGQKSIKRLESLDLTPALEMEMLESSQNLSTVLDYLGEDTLIILDDLLGLEDRFASMKTVIDTNCRTFLSFEEFLQKISTMSCVFYSAEPLEELSEVRSREQGYYSESKVFSSVDFEIFGKRFTGKKFHHPFAPIGPFLYPDKESLSGDEILMGLSSPILKDYELHFLVSSDSEEESVKRRILDLGVHMPRHTHFEKGYLSTGFLIPESHEMVLPMAEITHRYKIRRQKLRSTYHVPSSEFFDLIPGELVVHLHNGIGRYLGLETRENLEKQTNEFFAIEYADKSKLLVPLQQAHLITKYVGSTEESPKLHQLGSNRWKHQKEKTLSAIMNYASDLLKLYAEREHKGGYSFHEDSDDMRSFEDEFPFAETEDQLRAVQDIKADMISSKAMDRLVCGDVGYGKTEVAMRAAFKAVLDGGKQVAVLVPTTVLAMQHYENFTARMANFPLRIGVMSRFRSAKEIRETLKGIEEGGIDILIGTHRIISEDVKFKNLGLVIIDEEQRFGVKAKEHLKKIKAGVDALTLSATPIPRTLYMSLVGARDMSVISTPPQDRLPIKTILAEPSDHTFKTALLRELARDGQAYVIHNRVDTIFAVADRIKKLLPQARVVVGHGQMSAKEIDEVFHAFKQGRADILVATTIVENGIDIPNANTILIDRADHFGLADLYQLRGRVGRWNRRAYSYFLVSSLKRLSEISRKRLEALAAASGYGGGMKLAMKDLEIRGAGDILGYEQSGHVASIGFHLYCKLLKRTVLAMQGKAPAVLTETKFDIPVPASLPSDYVNEVSLRMDIYQRLGEAISFEAIDSLFDEIKDRFGEFPQTVLWLYHMTRLRLFASLNNFTQLKMEKYSLFAEQQKGKHVQSKKLLFSLPKKPKEFEEKLVQLLKSEFKTR